MHGFNCVVLLIRFGEVSLVSVLAKISKSHTKNPQIPEGISTGKSKQILRRISGKYPDLYVSYAKKTNSLWGKPGRENPLLTVVSLT